MKRIIQKYRFSKFKRIMDGLLFASISIISLLLCLSDISDHTASFLEIMLPFITAIISMAMGFVFMFRENAV
jgi:uncharacterized membrane protein